MTGAHDIRTVCFDLGGVLIRICRTWEEGCKRAGIPVRHPEARARSAAERKQLIIEYQTGRITGDEFAQRVSRVLGNLYSPDEIMTVHHAWMHGEYPGVGDVIAELNSAMLITAALSNTNREHWDCMHDFPGVMSLAHRFASHELGLHKPDPAIFREVESRLVRAGVDHGTILYFDDLEENIDAASAAGWIAVHVEHAGDTAAQIRTAAEAHGLLPAEAKA